MWKALFIVVVLSISASPLDAAQPDNGKRFEKTQPQPQRGGDLRRDVDRISKEIYRRTSAPPPQRRR